MGIGAGVRLFRYSFTTSDGITIGRRCFVRVDEFTTTLLLGGFANSEPAASPPINTFNFTIPPATRSGGVNACARCAIVRFTSALPAGLVTERKSVVVLAPNRFDQYVVGMTGTYRGLPVELIAKVDGSPGSLGGF